MKGLSLILLPLLLVACGNVQEKKLVGKWQAISLIEDGMPIPVPPSEVGFEFSPQGYYNFRSTLNYKEAGTFYVSGSLLFTMDTLNEASTEKSVQILDLTKDSLFIRMNDEGRQRIVKLGRLQ
ncbi:MAG: lipocalin family protein [Saprospiraceae bacterium]|nr:lipocalin family protein [Saprospiraceae bacterium]MCF8249208.1 lipocalin family protein [Saprospiraceae bacterium]MCF8280185.1 lipocalin family protein [Bacteroidales bacterium]MCF8311337.1 lipocalin family protein [Saprospiraceae bacterium]MCF8440099.1 lipocalin family protein [Saprospiraceae bacterium]